MQNSELKSKRFHLPRTNHAKYSVDKYTNVRMLTTLFPVLDLLSLPQD